MESYHAGVPPDSGANVSRDEVRGAAAAEAVGRAVRLVLEVLGPAVRLVGGAAGGLLQDPRTVLGDALGPRLRAVSVARLGQA